MTRTVFQGRQLLLSSARGVEIIDIDSIVRVEAISNYSKLFFADGKTLVAAKVLRWFEEQLSGEPFVRIHRGHLVNGQYIERYIDGQGGQICLRTGEYFDVSRRKRSLFLRYWQAA